MANPSATKPNAHAQEKGSHRFAVPRPILIILAVYFCVFFAMAVRKFVVMNSDEELGVTLNAFWNTIHGRLFYSPYVGMSLLGLHTCFAALIGLPLFWLFPSMYTLLFLQSFTLTVSGYVFYLIARKVHQDERTALLLMVGFLFYPTIVTNHTDTFPWEQWALPYLLAAFYFFISERFWPFLVFAFLGMTGQENLPLTIGMFGVYALVKRRNWRWIIVPIVMALVYGLFAFKVVIPHFAGARGYIVSRYFGDLGNTPGELVKTAITQPWRIIAAMCQADRVMYLVMILQPFLFLIPFCAWEVLFVLPSLGINLFVSESAFRVIAWHYNLIVGSFLYVAAVFGIKNLSGWLERRWHVVQPQFVLALAICTVSIASWPLWFNASMYTTHAYYPTLQKVLEIIPPNKSLLTPLTMLGHFSDRESALTQFQFDPTQPLNEIRPLDEMYKLDYIILDANERRFPKAIVTRDLVMSFYTNVNYELILNESNVFVFRRRTAE